MALTTARVGVLMGGRSAERDVSLRTGQAVHQALTRLGYDAVAIDVGPSVARDLYDLKVALAFILVQSVWLGSVAIAASIGDPAWIDPVIAKAQGLDGDSPYQELRAFADRHAAAAPLFAPEIAARVAESTHADLVPQYPALAEMLAAIAGALPKADLLQLVKPAIALLDGAASPPLVVQYYRVDEP